MLPAFLKPPVTKASALERVVEVDGRSLPLTINPSLRATRLTLRIEPGGRALKLTVPKGLPQREVDAFIERHRGWLTSKLARFSGESELMEGGTIALRGVVHRIELSGRLRGLPEIVVTDDEPVLRLSGDPEHLRRRLAEFLKKEARTDLERLVAIHAGRMGGKVKSVTLKDTRSRWGSCTSEGALSFSWRIVMAPPHVIDYLAAHEVAHLREMNHGPQFWALCEMLCPRTAEARHWLKRNGSMLHALDFS
ncbi:hypothetical protein BJF93_15885 [Xaviernesmea oryzae]|uniref:YgjP-like metallopeptidase domain-containing protein n=1 Tax=Xaviernesmea oryzae TaxID=464029 RepID=A0A1Q9AY94_9HYPH|nr:SprT family zinc-dependent metalloprotease [Xaviernesmea oryzae]OLP60419.1 hypothetical protein BJF93_15885 [Xaviernesmea oryzae]SEK19337.1 hypothetical protein SAMN04487976_10139 [Xaviernesmea oryzae]